MSSMEAVNHEYYVSPEVAKLLKEAGFVWEVNHSYPDCESLDNSCSGYMEDLPFYHNLNDGKYGGMSVPTLTVAQKWLRDVKGYELWVYPFSTHYRFSFYGYLVNEDNYTNFDTYEEALEAGIKKVLEIILEKRE